MFVVSPTAKAESDAQLRAQRTQLDELFGTCDGELRNVVSNKSGIRDLEAFFFFVCARVDRVISCFDKFAFFRC